MIQERTKAGLAAVRARGRSGGRPKLMVNDARVVLAKKLHADKSLEIEDICKTLRISRSTFYRYVRFPKSNSPQNGPPDGVEMS